MPVDDVAKACSISWIWSALMVPLLTYDVQALVANEGDIEIDCQVGSLSLSAKAAVNALAG
jgi:hypothetical protein